MSNFNPNLKVQKNLLKLKEMALQNQQTTSQYYSSNLVNSSMVLPPYSLEDLNSSFVTGDNYSSQLRAKNAKYQNTNRLSKPTPMSSVHMAKDIYRKGVSQSSTRANNFANNNNNSHGVYRREKPNVLNTSVAQSQKRSSTYVRYA